MSLFTAAEIADMHATYAEALVDTCTITRGLTTVATDVPCAVVKGIRSTMPGAAMAPFDKRVDFTVCLQLGTDVLTADVIVVDATGMRLRVGEVVLPASTYDHAVFAETTREDA